MVLAIGFGPLIFETALSRNIFWHTSCSLNIMLSAQPLSQNIPRSLILYAISLPLTIYPHAAARWVSLASGKILEKIVNVCIGRKRFVNLVMFT